MRRKTRVETPTPTSLRWSLVISYINHVTRRALNGSISQTQLRSLAVVAAVLPGEIHFETEQNQISNCCDEPMVAT